MEDKDRDSSMAEKTEISECPLMEEGGEEEEFALGEEYEGYENVLDPVIFDKTSTPT